MTALDEAERYRARGWVPIPIPRGQKAPGKAGWQNITLDTALRHFKDPESNIGILLGDVSSGLVDIDLDCAEAVDLARDFLPETLTFGRASRPRSHWLYVAPKCSTEKFRYDTGEKDDRGRAKFDNLLELRANADGRAAGLQTIFPPSVHPSGEVVSFEDVDAAPAEIAPEELTARVRQLAAATLLVRAGFQRETAVRAAIDLDAAIAEGLAENIAEPVRRWLGAEATPAPTRSAAPSSRPPVAGRIAEAIEQWNADHPVDYPRHTGTCPACGHKDCFGRLPDDATRWYCFSASHPDGVGIRGQQGYHGDALDLEAHARGCKPIEVLARDGYYFARKPRQEPAQAPRRAAGGAEAVAAAEAAPAREAKVVPIDKGKRVYRNNSYLTAVQIVEANDRDVLGQGARLEFDEMAGRVMLNRKPIEDVDETRVRAEVERKFVGGVDPEGRPKGLRLSGSDIRQAINQVARSRSYHPVREYLSGLKWDGVARLDQVAEDVLGAPRTVLNQALPRRYLVSAVARAMVPGCKVDTALILVGKTGLGKSSFFRILAAPWFIDTMLDVTSPKALMTLRRAWIYEWAELEVMRRVEDINAAKAWVSSPTDEYVPQYGHNPVEVPRGFVVAGTTEEPEFLVDEKGNRRWWPLTITQVDRPLLREQRDQLWAEAMHIYRAWTEAGAKEEDTPWVLNQEENRELDAVHVQHHASDSWADAVLEYAEKQLVDFTTADVLEHAIKKPIGQRNKGDETRVVTILKRAGWKLHPNKPAGKSRPWIRGAK